jgi:rubrerythrin
MNIKQAKPILMRQRVVKRTPFGRPIHEKALDALDATLQDEDNYGSETVQCESCGFIISILLTENGCPNCGIEELRTNIIE